MVEQVALSRALLAVLEDSEASDQVMAALVRLSCDSLVPMRQLLEEAHRHLECAIVGPIEDTSDEREAHPPLTHDGVGGLHLALDGHPLVGSDGADGDAPDLLDLLHAHQLVDTLGVNGVVAVADLEALYGVFSRLVVQSVDVTLLSIVL